MKNELGIEVKCKNCFFYAGCAKHRRSKKIPQPCAGFFASVTSCKARVKELQEQQFTEEELQFIKRAVLEYSEMSDFDYKPVDEKIERILNNE